MLKPKPQWLDRLTPAGSWVTLSPDIYYPSYVKNPYLYPDIIAHEKVHIRQQNEMGLKLWVTRYFSDREFRVDHECEAAAAQILIYPSLKASTVKTFESLLEGSAYFYAANSPEQIQGKIEYYLKKNPVADYSPTEPPPSSFPSITYPAYNTWTTNSWDSPLYNPWITPLQTKKNHKDEPFFALEDEYKPWDFDDPSTLIINGELNEDKSPTANKNLWPSDPFFMENYRN